MKLLWLLHFNRTILIHTPPMGRNKEEKENEHVRNSILIHTPSMGRNRKIFDICTHLACRFVHYTNQRRRLAYSQFSGVYIINNPCERYGGFMCTLCSHSTVHLLIGDPPFYIYSIAHCCILPFFTDEMQRQNICGK